MTKLQSALLALSFSLFTACTTTGPTPVSSNFSNSYAAENISVRFAENQGIAKVYDEAVREMIDTDGGSTRIENFKEYISNRGGAGENDDRLAELYVEYRIAENVLSGTSTNMRGDIPVDIDIRVTDATTPNAATMMLVGEIKNISYDMDVKTTNDGKILIDYSAPSAPFVEKSAGAGGGLLGLALRSGKNQHVTDLEQMITAVSREVITLMFGPDTNLKVIEKAIIDADIKK